MPAWREGAVMLSPHLEKFIIYDQCINCAREEEPCVSLRLHLEGPYLPHLIWKLSA
jgi:hypothetical protein